MSRVRCRTTVLAVTASLAMTVSSGAGAQSPSPLAASSAPAPSPMSADASDPVGELHNGLTPGGTSDAFGGVIVVGHDHEQVLAEGYGLQGSGDPYTAATPFSIASLGKMFTAVAIGQLLDAGKLALDDRVGAYVSDLPPGVADAKIAQFLSHTSGLGDAIEDGIVGEPGTFRYTNAGFDVLARVVEAVSGQTLSGYLGEHVFKPAGMSDTSLREEAPGEDPIGWGGEASTGPDLMRFVEALLGDRLLTPETTDLFTSAKVETDQGGQYGYGFEIYGDPAQRPSIGHVRLVGRVPRMGRSERDARLYTRGSLRPRMRQDGWTHPRTSWTQRLYPTDGRKR